MPDAPTWALANETIRYLMGAGLTLEEAFGKAERQAIALEAPDLPMPPRAPVLCGDRERLRAECLGWDPGLGPYPILSGGA
jgi:hypothetical protein